MLPLDVMPIGHTYSIGFTQMYAPTPSRRRVGAYVLHVCPDTTTPISQLDIHQDLVTFGGFTPATARLALVDGQPPSDFARPGLPWIQTVPLHTPALGFGTFPATLPAPSIISSSSPSTATDFSLSGLYSGCVHASCFTANPSASLWCYCSASRGHLQPVSSTSLSRIRVKLSSA